VLTAPQLSSLALLSIKLYESVYAISLGLFSGSCLLTGYLIFRSTFLPRAIGVLLAIAGIRYALNTVVALMPKGFAEYLFPWIFLRSALRPILLGFSWSGQSGWVLRARCLPPGLMSHFAKPS
jgi:hypothetical protein